MGTTLKCPLDHFFLTIPFWKASTYNHIYIYTYVYIYDMYCVNQPFVFDDSADDDDVQLFFSISREIIRTGSAPLLVSSGLIRLGEIVQSGFYQNSRPLRSGRFLLKTTTRWWFQPI